MVAEDITEGTQIFDEKDKGKHKGPLVYIPSNAKINSDNTNASPPKTIYDRNQAVFDRDALKRVTGRDSDV